MPLFVPKFKPEVRDSTVQKAVAKECPIIRRGSATGVRLAEVQWGISRVVVKKSNHKNQNQKIKKQVAGKNRGQAKTKASRQSKSLK